MANLSPFFAVLAGLSLASLGCVGITKTPIRTEIEVDSSTERVVPNHDFRTTVTRRGDTLIVDARRLCHRVLVEEITTTVISDRKFDDDEWVGGFTLMSLVGAVPLHVGAGLLIDAPNVYDSDRNSRTYNETSQSDVIGVGVGLAAVGLALSIPPLIHGLTAVGTSSETTQSTRESPLSADMQCTDDAPISVSVGVEGHELTIGETSRDGRLEANLKERVLPWAMAKSPRPPRELRLFFDGREKGGFSISDLLDERQAANDRADHDDWRLSSPSECRASPSRCGGVETYLGRHPNGLHAEEARELLRPRTLQIAKPPLEECLSKCAESCRTKGRACLATCPETCQ